MLRPRFQPGEPDGLTIAEHTRRSLRRELRQCRFALPAPLATIAEIEEIPRVPQLAGARESSLVYEVLQIACRRRARGLCDADIVLGAQATLEAIDALLEHAGDRFRLALIQLATHTLVELRLCNIEIDAPDRRVLRFDNRVSEICHPISDLDVLVVALKCRVVVLALTLNRVGQRNQCRLAECLGQRFFRERASNASVPILERVDALEIDMSKSGARERRQGAPRSRCGGIEPRNESLHFFWHARRRRGLEMHRALV